MSRYKSIKFDQFSDGKQCDILEPTDKSFEDSENLFIRKNKIKLGHDLFGGVLYNTNLVEVVSDIFIYASYVYFFGTDENDCIIKKCLVNDGTISTVSTLPDSGNEAVKFIRFKNTVVVSYLNNAESDYLCKYSTNGITMTTWADTNLIALAGASVYINSYIIFHDRLYILASDEKIYYTDDGITFTLLVALDPDYSYNDLEYLNGYLYVIGSGFGMIRLSLEGKVLEEIFPIKAQSGVKFYQKVFNGHLYVIYKKTLYRLEGSSLIPIFKSADYFYFRSTHGFFDILGLSMGGFAEMNIDEKFFNSYDVSLGNFISLCYSWPNIVGIVYSGGYGKLVLYDKSDYTSSGNIESQIKKIPEGLAVPKQLILNHKPLTANAWVKVYIKYDQASSWGDAVINSNATNAVRKIYNIPRGTKCSFIQVKIEYGTGDSAETPEDATVEFVYLPVGLLTSR